MMPSPALLFVTKVSSSGRPAAVTCRSEDTFTITSYCIAYVCLACLKAVVLRRLPQYQCEGGAISRLDLVINPDQYNCLVSMRTMQKKKVWLLNQTSAQRQSNHVSPKRLRSQDHGNLAFVSAQTSKLKNVFADQPWQKCTRRVSHPISNCSSRKGGKKMLREIECTKSMHARPSKLQARH